MKSIFGKFRYGREIYSPKAGAGNVDAGISGSVNLISSKTIIKLDRQNLSMLRKVVSPTISLPK